MDYKMNKHKHFIEYLFFLTILYSFYLFPPGAVSYIGKKFGQLCFALGIRKKVVQKNLEVAFKETHSNQERNLITKKVYENAGMVLFEFLKMQSMSNDQITDCIEIEGLQKLDDALKKSRGVVLAGCHYGNWELLSAGTSQLGKAIHGYAGKQKNLLVDRGINKIRQKFGMRTISKAKNAPREMIKVLKNNEILAIGGDLNVPHDNLFVDFFGKPAAVGKGQVSFAVKLDSPLLFFWNERISTFRYKGHIEVLEYSKTGNLELDINAATRAIFDRLEQIIQLHPDHYFWFNRRWKTRPEGDANIYKFQ